MRTVVLLVSLVFGSLAIAAPAPPSVTVETVSMETAGDGIRVSGVVQSRHDVLLSATVDGELDWVLEPGIQVEAGTVVAQVDSEQLALLVDEQKVLLARAEANLDYLSGELERVTELQQRNLASDTQLAELDSRRTLAAAEVDVVKVRIRQLEERLSRTRIVAPVGGVIAERRRQGGEFANRGEVIVRLVNPMALEVSANVPVHHAMRLRAGEKLSVTVTDREMEGELRAVVYAATEASQTIEVLVDLPTATPGVAIDGQFAEVNIPLADEEPALFVPRDAVVLRSSGSYVFRINSENKAEKVDVVLGKGRGDLVSVTGQLAAGDRVAVRGAQRLSDGQEVTPG